MSIWQKIASAKSAPVAKPGVPQGVLTQNWASCGNSPRAITSDAAGNVYVSCVASADITKIAPNGAVTMSFVPPQSGGYAIYLDRASNYLYASANAINKILKVDASTGAINGGYWGGISRSCRAFAYLPSGEIYVPTNGDLDYIPTSGTTSKGVAAVSGNPYGVVYDGADSLYTANQGTGTVSKITISTRAVINTYATVGPGPTGICMDKQGNIYVLNAGNKTVSKIDPSGTTTLVWATVIANPNSIAIDVDDNIYVAHTSGVSKITPQGVVDDGWVTTPWGGVLCMWFAPEGVIYLGTNSDAISVIK